LFVNVAAKAQITPVAQLDLYDLFLLRVKAKPQVFDSLLVIYRWFLDRKMRYQRGIIETK